MLVAPAAVLPAEKNLVLKEITARSGYQILSDWTTTRHRFAYVMDHHGHLGANSQAFLPTSRNMNAFKSRFRSLYAESFALFGYSNPTQISSILWQNEDVFGVDESAQIQGGVPDIRYSCIQGWTGELGGVGTCAPRCTWHLRPLGHIRRSFLQLND